MSKFIAQIVEDETGKVVQQSKPTSAAHAERIEEGMGINLNWGKYHTTVIEVADE